MALRYHYPQGVLQAFRVRKAGTSLVETRSDARSGTSLVETLVSMTLLGVIFIPMLFLSSAFFLAQLAKARQNVDVSVNAARFSNQFMEELYRTQRVLPDSNDTEIHFSYYDGIRQEAVIRGYRLTTSGSYQILEKLVYDTATNTWTALSPYGTVQADQVLLPTTSVFAYCDSAGCGANPEQALFVQLSGWEFMPAKNTNRKVDFPDMDVYLSAGASSADMMLANAPQELYSFDDSTSFGNGANLNLVHINPTGQKFNYLNVIGGGSGTLTTILPTTLTYPGVYSTAVAPDGRVFFAPYTGNGKFNTWKSDTGLSTLLTSNWSYPGAHSTAVSPIDGRVLFGADDLSSQVHTWKSDTGLSLVLPAVIHYPGSISTSVSPADGRFFFGQAGGAGRMYTWATGTGLSTILSVNETNPGMSSSAVAPDGRLYFGETGTGRFWTWHTATKLSTILPVDETGPGTNKSTTVDSNGRVFFGEAADPGSYWTYHTSTGLSTILNGIYNPGTLMSKASTVAGRVYFSTSSDTPGNGVLWTWDVTTGLSTIASSVYSPGWGGYSVVGSDGRLFYGLYSGGASYNTWHVATGLSTIISGVTGPGNYGAAVDSNNRVFFGVSSSPGQMYTWKSDTGLSTLLPATIVFPGRDSTTVSPLDGRVFFGQAANPGQVYTWKSDTGLSTLLPAGINFPAQNAIAVTAGGRLYFGQNASASGQMYTWGSDPPTYDFPRVTSTGSKTNQPLSVTVSGNPSYSTNTQAFDGELYFSDYSAKTIDRYTFSSGSFSQTTQFNWGTSTGAVGAIAVDQNKAGIALLDTANKQIDYYSNRKVTGSPTAANQYALTATTTPTGLAVSGRTGNYLVLDSAQQGSNPDKYVRLFVYNDTGTQITNSPWKIYIDDEVGTDYPLSVDATGETTFKIQYDDEKNILYLIAPTVGRVYALTLPEPL